METIKNKQETRSFIGSIGIEKRDDDTESRTVTGLGAIFDTWSEDLGFFREKIDPRAFDGTLKKRDIISTFNHNFDNVMARTSSKTLKLSIEKEGLRYKFDAPDTTAGNDLLANIRNGNVKGSSFIFTVEQDTWTFNKNDEIDERTINKVDELIEVGPVVLPAYTDTTAAQRSLDEKKKEDEEPDQDTDEVDKKAATDRKSTMRKHRLDELK